MLNFDIKTRTYSQNCWFIADYHLSHANVIKYDKRPFKDIQEMEDTIVANHNNLVKPDDTVFFLGDFCFDDKQAERLIKSFNGKTHLVIGNHDRVLKRSNKLLSLFESVSFYKEIYVEDNDVERGKQFICLSHYPLHEWNRGHHGSWMIHGHSHGHDNYNKSRKILNVGVMLNNYKPFSYQQIKKIMNKKENIKYG